MVVPDPLKAPDEVNNQRVECLEDPFDHGYGSKAYYNMQECLSIMEFRLQREEN